jgi:hypothetical protein
MKRLTLIALIITCFAVPAAANAQNGYTNVAGTTESGGGGGTPQTQAVATTDSGGESLPFTGLELSLMLGAGVLLLGTGLVLRRVRTQ